MRRCVLAVVVLCLAFGPGRSPGDDKPEPKVDAAKLQGRWEGKPTVDLGPDAKSVVEFGKDGKVKMGVVSEKLTAFSEGTYKVEGERVSFAMTKPKESSFAVTIVKLTDDDLEWRNEDKAVVAFKRAKADKK